MRARTWGTVLGLSILPWMLPTHIEAQKWHINSANIVPTSGMWSGMLHADLVRTDRPTENATITAPVISDEIDEAFASGDRLVILGQAGRAQAVEVFDIPSRRKIDWFFCYSPRRISDT